MVSISLLSSKCCFSVVSMLDWVYSDHDFAAVCEFSGQF